MSTHSAELFIAKVSINHLLRSIQISTHKKEKWRNGAEGVLKGKRLTRLRVLKLDKDFKRALEKYQMIEKLLEKLPAWIAGPVVLPPVELCRRGKERRKK